MATTAKASNNVGKVVQVIGNVLDIVFVGLMVVALIASVAGAIGIFTQ